jgi:hypothetical protein
MRLRSSWWFATGFGLVMGFGWFVFPNVIYKNVDQPLQFNHKLHTGETVGQQCSDCHELLSDGSFSGIPTNEKCGVCHAERIGSSVAESLMVVDYISKGREIPWLSYAHQPENVYFSHTPHLVKAKLPCERCHGEHGKTDQLRPLQVNRISTYSRDIWGSSIIRWKRHEWDGMRMVDCSDCHERHQMEESCIDCHK